MPHFHWTGDDEPAGIAASPLRPASSRRVLDLTEFPDLLESLERQERRLADAVAEVSAREKELRRRAAALAQWTRVLVCAAVAVAISVLMVIQAAQSLVLR